MRVDVRCGECATTRGETLHWLDADEALTRIERIGRRQLRTIERDLRVLSAAPAAGYQPARQRRAVQR